MDELKILGELAKIVQGSGSIALLIALYFIRDTTKQLVAMRVELQTLIRVLGRTRKRREDEE